MILSSALIFMAVTQAAVWKPYPLADGFSVDLPGKPTMDAIDKEAPNDRMWLAQHPQGTIVHIGYFPLDDEEPADLQLAGFMMGMVGQGMPPIRTRDTMSQGWPGLEFTVKVDTEFLTCRVYQSGKAFYYMGVQGLKEKEIAPVALRVFNSFKFPKNAGQGPQTSPGPTFTPTSVSEDMKISFPREPAKQDMTWQGTPPAPMHRFHAQYGIRVFLVGVIDLPDEALKAVANSSQSDTAASLSEGMLKDFKGKILSEKTYKIGDVEVVSKTVKFDKDMSWARVDTFRKGKRMYGVLHSRLAVNKDDPEVETFFKSIAFGG